MARRTSHKIHLVARPVVQTGATNVRVQPPPASDYIASRLLGAVQARHDGVTAATHDHSNTHNRYFLEFLDKCNIIDDPFLERYTPQECNELLGAFAHAVCGKEFSASSQSNAELVASTCQAAVNNVCSAFIATGRPNPSLDADGKTARLLQHQLKGYKNNDPSMRQQKPIPVELIRMMIDRETNDPGGLQAFHELVHLAFFFAMRS